MSLNALWLILLLPACLYLGVALYWPLANTFTESFGPGGSLDNYVKIVSSEAYRSIFWTTIRLALETTALTAIISYPVAFFFANSSRRLALFLTSLVLVPFWISVLIRSYAWIILLRDDGVINSTLKSAGIINHSIRLVYNETGVIIGMVYTMLPYMILTIYSGLTRIDQRLVPAARSLGASAVYAFRRVYFPLSLPGISAGMTLVFIHAIGFYVTPALLSGGRVTTIAMIIETQMLQVMEWGFASALSIILLLLVLAIVFVWMMAVDAEAFGFGGSKKQPVPETSTAAERSEVEKQNTRLSARAALTKPLDLGGTSARSYSKPPVLAGWLSVQAAAIAVLLFLILPVFVIVALSFDGSTIFRFPPSSLSLRWYREYFVGSLWVSSTIFSLQIAIAVALLSTILGGLAAIGLHRSKIRGKAIISGILISPMIVPVIVTAFAMYAAFLKLNLVGTYLGLVLAHTVIAMPPVILLVGAALRRFDDRLEDAALTLGASRWYAWRRVLIPRIMPGVLAGGLFAFLTSFDEVVISIFLAGAFSPTLPKRIWDSVRLDIEPTVSAVAALLILVVTVITLIGISLERKAGVGVAKA